MENQMQKKKKKKKWVFVPNPGKNGDKDYLKKSTWILLDNAYTATKVHNVF
jgi:hypothetical protein